MDNFKTFVVFGLVVVSLLLWDAWQNDYVRPQQAQQQTTSVNAQSDAAVPLMNAPTDLSDLPPESTSSLSALPDSASQQSNNAGDTVHIKTDVIDAHISVQGGDIRQLALLKYPVESSQPNVPVQFLNDKSQHFFVTQSGLLSAEKNGPIHNSAYQSKQNSYQLSDGEDSIEVPLYWQSEQGMVVTKIYRFHRDSYMVDVEYQVTNDSDQSFAAMPYAQFNRTRPEDDSTFIYTFTGAAFSSKDNRYEKVSFDDLNSTNFNMDVDNGWAAMMQHYFVAALVPNETSQQMNFYGRSIKDKNYTAGIKLPLLTVPAGSSGQASYKMYIGPKDHNRLEAVADYLDLTVDFGKLTIISQPLFMVMDWFHKITNNWGWSIVLLTILIKLVFYRLSAASYRSMAGMRKLAPKLTALKERCGDDKQKFQQEMMKLYRTEKINPLGGCLPILVQMPVFLAFYWVLVESIELRQAPFILWIQDLTAMDPYFILPLLFGVSMFVQQQLNPPPQDPAQAMVMKILPIVFTVFFAFFPAGLVLYWVVNNILSIAQQWYITRKMGAI